MKNSDGVFNIMMAEDNNDEDDYTLISDGI